MFGLGAVIMYHLLLGYAVMNKPRISVAYYVAVLFSAVTGQSVPSWMQFCCMCVLPFNLRPRLTVQPLPGSRWSHGRGKKVMSMLHKDS